MEYLQEYYILVIKFQHEALKDRFKPNPNYSRYLNFMGVRPLLQENFITFT